MPTCSACGSPNADSARFCQACGSRIETSPQAVEPVPTQYNDFQSGTVRSYPVPPAYPTQTPIYSANPPAKQKSTGFLLEILPGLFGILGIGHIYAGNTTTGFVWLIGSLIWASIAVGINILTVGVGFLCTVPIAIILLVISVLMLNAYMTDRPNLFGV